MDFRKTDGSCCAHHQKGLQISELMHPLPLLPPVSCTVSWHMTGLRRAPFCCCTGTEGVEGGFSVQMADFIPFQIAVQNEFGSDANQFCKRF
jgi:hypothetical protein